ncbi:DUF885 domain-containing protein [Ornithinimicrobium faecis]|uniref:DUF885 domain-containing protein n=1 Tax=Ornithinimicrobium faecis TaxID=2934158 RepID=A0ABY4YX14_9MICO|nr:DUF885 domain-containing protein [Ornithinimicrobium sp. HY1793]USQ81269.1 DUF885 domain-containing protein [Ornithinimicrobium sp. HY1793]
MSSQPEIPAVDELGDHYLDTFTAAYPFTATVFGLPGHDAEVQDVSEQGRADLARTMAQLRDQVSALAPDELTPTERASRSLLLHTTSTVVDSVESRESDWQIGGLVGPVYAVLAMVPKVTLDSAQRGQDYEARLARLDGYLDQSIDALRRGVRDGLVANRRLVESTVSTLDAYLGAGVAADPLLQPLGQLADEAGRARIEESVTGSVRPAMARLRRALAEEVLPAARPDDRGGMTYLPGGDEAYTKLVRQHTTTDRTVEELHATGLTIAEKLRGEFSELGSRVLGTGDVAEVTHRLREDPGLRFSSGEEMLHLASEAMRRAEEAVPDWFNRWHQAACEIGPLNAAEAETSALGYYQPPAGDGTRPGRCWLNTSHPEARPRYEMETLTFHETVPGHHLQFALSQELTELPAYRRFAYVTAFGEGWGLYTERLGDEMGIYSDDLARFGMVSFDAWRAARLVVDTGIHALGWSRQQAIDYMWDNTALTRGNIINEVDRYTSMPGQALAYMTGRLEIVRLRKAAEAELGARFDIKAFHDTVLGGGSVPLSELADVVTRWSATHADEPETKETP